MSVQQDHGERRRRQSDGLALLSYGFRPFFLFGSFYAALIILVWLPLFHGTVALTSAFSPVDWHAHETLFGYGAAIITGFLLTAIPNWTGRLPLRGNPLLALLLLWVAGRVAVLASGTIGWVAAAVIDSLFLAAVAAAAAREIVAGRNWRNLVVLIPVTVLLAANMLFHVEAATAGSAGISYRLGLSAILALIMIVGGRVVPSFTRNWLVRENPGPVPVPFNRFDALVILVSVAALLVWTFAPEGRLAGGFLLAAGVLNLVRLARWRGHRTGRDNLVLILHVAYAFVPAGFLLAGMAALEPLFVPPVTAVHAFGVGAIGTMTLAIMTRATLGHTGRRLHADAATAGIYAAVILAAGLRVASAFMPGQPGLLHLAAGLWVAAFLGYCLRYGGMLVKPASRS